MSYKNILIETNEQIGYIIINRPEVRNALNKETLDEIVAALETYRLDESIGLVIFTGAGEKAFAAGADIGQLQTKTTIDALKPGGMQQVYDIIENYEKPTIAMINGFALGGGCELAMACDIRIASTNAKLGLPELNLSIIPGAGGTQRLVRIVGRGKALEMILTGKMVSAQEAERFGLVSEVVEPEQLKEKALEVAKQILAKGPLAVRLAKLAVGLGSDVDMRTGQMIERLSSAILLGSADKLEGTSAFLEKRRPNFSGK